MQGQPIAVQLASLRQPLRRGLETAARLGAAGVSIDARHGLRPEELSQSGLRQLRKLLDDLNLRVSAIEFPTRRGFETTNALDRRLAAAREALRLAADLRARALVIRPGLVPRDEEDSRWQTLRDALGELCRAGLHLGVTPAAQTGGQSGADFMRLIGALPEGLLGVDLHPGRLILTGHDPAEALAALGPHVVHVTVADAVRDLAAGRGDEVQLGRGAVDLPGLLAGLEEHAYRGWLTIERREGDDPVGQIGMAVRYLKALRE